MSSSLTVAGFHRHEVPRPYGNQRKRGAGLTALLDPQPSLTQAGGRAAATVHYADYLVNRWSEEEC